MSDLSGTQKRVRKMMRRQSTDMNEVRRLESVVKEEYKYRNRCNIRGRNQRSDKTPKSQTITRLGKQVNKKMEEYN